jgi:hypothetical protein
MKITVGQDRLMRYIARKSHLVDWILVAVCRLLPNNIVQLWQIRVVLEERHQLLKMEVQLQRNRRPELRELVRTLIECSKKLLPLLR